MCEFSNYRIEAQILNLVPTVEEFVPGNHEVSLEKRGTGPCLRPSSKFVKFCGIVGEIVTR